MENQFDHRLSSRVVQPSEPPQPARLIRGPSHFCSVSQNEVAMAKKASTRTSQSIGSAIEKTGGMEVGWEWGRFRRRWNWLSAC